MRHFLCFLFICFCIGIPSGFTQSFPYQNPHLPVETRVQDLLQRMRPEEKFQQLFMLHEEDIHRTKGYEYGVMGMQIRLGIPMHRLSKLSSAEITRMYASEINRIQSYFVQKTRLGIPVLFFEESLHGLCNEESTIFPQSIALAASFDTILMARISDEMAQQCLHRGIRQVLSPVVNLATDVRWGRTEETYGEDPYLSARMGAAFVHGFEQQGVITTPKHFIANVGEGGRDSYPIQTNEEWLWETHLQPFQACFDAGSRSVMSSYNAVNGEPCSANAFVLKTLLRDQLHFNGFVISDAGAVGGANVLHMTSASYAESGRKAIENGLDVILQTSIEHASLFNPDFLQQKVSQAAVDTAVARVLRIKFMLGLFEHPYVNIPKQKSTVSSAPHPLAYEAALKSIVLLRNEQALLPLPPKPLRIAVTGPYSKLIPKGGYSPEHSPFETLPEALQKQLKTGSVVQTFQTCQLNTSRYMRVPASQLSQVTATYYNRLNCQGPEIVKRAEKEIAFQYTWNNPDEHVDRHFYSVRYTGWIHFKQSGRMAIGLRGSDGYKMYWNEKCQLDASTKLGYQIQTKEVEVRAGDSLAFRIEFSEGRGNSQLELICSNPSYSHSISIDSIIQFKPDVVVFAAGIEEGEFQDRAHLQLTGQQNEVIQALMQASIPVIQVQFTGSAVIQPTTQQAQAILQAWYPGEAGAEAISAILTGKENPSGKLPITFPKSEGQLPLSYYHHPTGRGDDYVDESGEAAYPFGFGMSYSDFEINSSQTDTIQIKANATETVPLQVQNRSNMDGTEVVQWYIRKQVSKKTLPVMALRGFQRVEVPANQSQTIAIPLHYSDFKYGQNKVEPGMYECLIGNSSRNIQARIYVYISE